MRTKRILSALTALVVVLLAVGCDMQPLEAPVASLAAGSYEGTQVLSLSCSTKNAKIYYTIGGNNPTMCGIEYTGEPLAITHTLWLKAVARNKKGDWSPEIELFYGIIGPAGGYVFYDCDADNDDGNADGLVSTECGWRYLEAAPEDITDGQTTSFVFGYYRKSDDGENLYVNDSTVEEYGTFDPDDGKPTGYLVGTGKANTIKLVDKMGSSAYVDQSGPGTTAAYAAKLCDDYSVGIYDDWFLPSIDELLVMWRLKAWGFVQFASETYWSSSECNYPYYSCYVDYSNAFSTGYYRENLRRVRAIRAFGAVI